MTVAVQSRIRPGLAAETVQRRWRLAALLGLIILLALAGFAATVMRQTAEANRTTVVLKAAKDIHAGTVITADELGTTNVRVQDQAVLASLAGEGQRSQLIGQVAVQDVHAGSLVPAGLAAPQSSAALWDVQLPVKTMPAGLRPGDHVAILVSGADKSGQPIDFVVMQDVQVLSVQSGSVDLWLPAKVWAQMQWYAGHGGISLGRMQPGAVQQNLPPGGPS